MVVNKKDGHFVDAPETRRMESQGQILELLVTEDIFPPSAHGSVFMDHLAIRPGDRVLDVGTGTGNLAILAAKLGGEVDATDTDRNAVAVARENARRNGVNVNVQRGSYEGPFTGPYDVIIANLPQEILPDEYREQLGEALSRTMEGGPRGNELVLEFLERAPRLMHEESRLYMGAYSPSDAATTMKKMAECYDARLLGVGSGPVKGYIEEHIDWFGPRIREGSVHIYERDGRHQADVFIFELRKRPSAGRG